MAQNPQSIYKQYTLNNKHLSKYDRRRKIHATVHPVGQERTAECEAEPDGGGSDCECRRPDHWATMYVSLEPCSHYGKTPPCADLIIKKRIKRVVVGCIDEYAEVQGRGIKKLQDAGIEVEVGVLEAECKDLNRRFFTFHRENRPHIILKWAQTANGFIDDHFQPVQISSDFTKMLSHKLRAEEDAILVGRVTDKRDHPQLNVRDWCGPDPKRLVIDHQHPLNLDSLHAHRIQSLIVEGGAQTLKSFMEEGLWDELRVETNLSMTVTDGTRAPQIPAEAIVTESHKYDDNLLVIYRRSQ